MTRKYILVLAIIALAPIACGMTLTTPIASAEPDIERQVCNAIGQEGASVPTFLNLIVALSRKGVRNADGVIHQSVSSDCPQYGAALAETDRQAAAWERQNGGDSEGPGYGHCPSGSHYNPNRGTCQEFPYVPPQPGY
jgi:hypothetical protein